MKATKKILAAIISIMMLVSVIPMSAFAEDAPINYLHSAAITVTAPVEGEIISFDATGDSGNYTVTSVKWNNTAEYITNGKFAFVKGETYTVTVEITLIDGFEFSSFTATVNDKAADSVVVAENNKSATIKYSFICSEKQTEPGTPDTPDTPEQPEEPSVFEKVIEKIKAILGSAIGIMLQVIRHIAGF